MRATLLKVLDSINSLRGRNSFYAETKYLQKIEYNDKEEIIRLRNKKLKKIINYTYENSPAYKILWNNNNIKPNSFNDYSDLQKFPVITKDFIRKNFPNNFITNNNQKDALYDTTSGSSGKPLEFFTDKKSQAIRDATYMYFNTWMGVKPHDNHLHIKTIVKTSTKEKMFFWLTEKHLLNVLDIKKENLSKIITKIEKLKANYFEGYAASLLKLAILINEKQITIKNKPKAIISTSETLLNDQRELLKNTFNCNIYNRYGSREFTGAVAQECNYFNGFHVNPNLCFIEIVKEDNSIASNGEKGKILITDLNNYVMPFIRYEIGDIGIMGEEDCNCGRKFQNIKTIEGRTGEYLITKENEKIPLLPISSGLFSAQFSSYVYMFQFIQKSKGEMTIKIVPTKKYTPKIGLDILSYVKNQIEIKTELEIVTEINPEANGKTPLLIKKFN